MENNEIRISIRNLVEFVLRSGDLDSRFVGTNRMLEGTKAHQKIQREGGAAYNAEVCLSYGVEFDGFAIILEGRADGIITEEDGIVIDEIKTTTRPLETIDEDYNLLHWAQAKCYAYIYAVLNNIESLNVQLTYCRIDTEERKSIRRAFSIEELKDFFYDLVGKYAVWARLTRDWSRERDTSVRELAFPFDSYRKGQRELAVAAYKTIEEGKKLFAQAPTGIGKTISTLFPAVKAMGEGHISKIFYLTAKTITRQVAEEAFSRMRSRGLKFRTITLTAKDKICFSKGAGCNPEQCQYARGHFDRVNDAIFDILSREEELTREKIEEYSEKYRICPFEYALDLTLWADCVICDYNYVFDPRVYLRRFFLNNKEDYAFLIDEAHNLVDRAREMFSAELYKSSFLELKKIMKSRQSKVAKLLSDINKYMISLRKECGEQGFLVKQEELKDLYKLLKELIKESEDWLSKNHGSEGYEQMLELYFDSIAFIRISEFYDERYVTLIETKKSEVKVKLFCVDPSHLLRESAKRGKAAVFFSATLTPISYFQYILGGGSDDYSMILPSPFIRDNLCLLIADSISTKFKNRESSYDRIVEMIKSAVEQKPGNYIVYFPSYKYLNEVYTRFAARCPDVATLVQDSSMSEEERETFLAEFKPGGEKTLIGFAVLGGIFSEGVDLKGDRLIGAIIVGVGLPQISTEQDIIMDYFQAQNSMGYEYAYMFPGMNKVLQAAGRVIRSEKDRGMVLLIDERFSHRNYRDLFPEHWCHGLRIKKADDLAKKLQSFW